MLIKSEATSVFINKAFTNKHYLNTSKLFSLVPIYNMDGTLNKINQISEMINIVLQYKTYME